MSAIRARVGAYGGIALPAEYLRALNLYAGDAVVLRLEDGAIRILTTPQAIQQAQAIVRRHAPSGRSLADELIAERRAEADDDEA